MRDKLIKITDETINSLLKSDIILPSTYFKEFDKNAKILEIKVDDESFENEVNEVITQEFKTIDSYMHSTIHNIQKISQATEDASNAIKNRDENELAKIYHQMEELKHEIHELQHEMYIDSVTKTYNKKWIYSEFLDRDGNTKQKGIMALIYVHDYDYIRKEHGHLIADNLLIFIANFINKQLKNENIDFQIAHYTKDKFIVFFNQANISEGTQMLNDMQKNLYNSTLKSKSGILIKSSYKFNLMKYNQENHFQNMLEMLITDLHNK